MNKELELFELKDIEIQLTPKAKDYIEKVIFMAKETKKIQQIDGFIKPIIVFPSGKMMWKPPKETKRCKSCGQEINLNK